MSAFDRGRWNRCAVVFLLPAVISVSAAQQRPAPHPQPQKRMAQAVDITLQKGLQAKLPPHLSTLLGLSEEKETLFRQGLVRTEKIVQGFDVSTANKKDIVLFVVNETTHDQTLYLTSTDGVLRKVVSVKGGTGAVARISSEDRKAFEKEKQFWLDRLAPAGGSK